MGHARNMRITAYNFETLMSAMKLRDAVITCYEAKIK